MKKTALVSLVFLAFAAIFSVGCAAPPHTEAPNVGAERHVQTTIVDR